MDRPDSGSDMELRGQGGGHGGHATHEEQMFERQQRNFYMDLRVGSCSRILLSSFLIITRQNFNQNALTFPIY